VATSPGIAPYQKTTMRDIDGVSTPTNPGRESSGHFIPHAGAMTRAKERRVRYWDRQAPNYDKKMSLVERRLFADTRHWVCSRARGATLEVAIGTGANLAHYGADVELTGVDWSEAMLLAVRHQADRGQRPVALAHADAGALPFAADSFDTVVSTFALCCVADERAVLVEALRVLRPGGRLLLADHVAASAWPLRAVQHAVEMVSIPLQGEHYTRRPSAVLRSLDVTIEEDERLSMGLIERVCATKHP